MQNIYISLLSALILWSCSGAPSRVPVKDKTYSGSKDVGGEEANGDAKSNDPAVKAGDGSSKAGDKASVTPESSPAEVIGKVMEKDLDCTGQPLVGKSELRLLTRDEYQNSVRDLLGVKVDYRQGLPTDVKSLNFSNDAEKGFISDSHMAFYLDTAIQIADEIQPNLKNLSGCGSSDNDEACAKKLIEKLGQFLWRRPLSADEQKELVAYFAAAKASKPVEALRSTLVRLMVSPHFLYRHEIGVQGSLTPYELASALSYFFWGTVPDAELLNLAKAGTLNQENIIVAQATRLMASPKAQVLWKAFGSGWLNTQAVLSVSKSKDHFPQFTDAIRQAMAVEGEKTFSHFMTKEGADFSQLYLSNYSLGSPSLAEYYSAKALKNEKGEDTISFADSSRRGLLGLGSILSITSSIDETNPFRRGEYVLKNLLCHVPPPIPEGLEILPVKPEEGLSTRERFAKHSSAPGCRSCHVQIDGVGFGMEDYDAVGLFRTVDNKVPIDASGQLIGFDGNSPKFKGVDGLSAVLAESGHAKRCFTTQWYRYAHGHLEKESDVCSIRDISARFESGELSLAQLIIKLITHPSFQKRGN